jgi:hypothetical protein
MQSDPSCQIGNAQGVPTDVFAASLGNSSVNKGKPHEVQQNPVVYTELELGFATVRKHPRTPRLPACKTHHVGVTVLAAILLDIDILGSAQLLSNVYCDISGCTYLQSSTNVR